VKVRGYDGPTGLNQTGDQDLATRRFLTFKLIGLTDLEVEEDCSAIEEQQPKPKKRWSRKVEPNEVDSKEKEKDKDKDKEKAKKRWSRKVEPNEEGDSKEKEKDKDKEKEKEKEKRLSKELGEPFAVFATATNTRHKFLAHSPEDRGKWIKALKDTIAEHNVRHHPQQTHSLSRSHTLLPVKRHRRYQDDPDSRVAQCPLASSPTFCSTPCLVGASSSPC